MEGTVPSEVLLRIWTHDGVVILFCSKEKNRKEKGQGGKTGREEMNNNKKAIIIMALYPNRFRGIKKIICVYFWNFEVGHLTHRCQQKFP